MTIHRQTIVRLRGQREMVQREEHCNEFGHTPGIAADEPCCLMCGAGLPWDVVLDKLANRKEPDGRNC